MRNSLDKMLVVLGTTVGPVLESNTLNFETLMHNFTSLSTISPNFRTICPVVTENLSRQNLDRRRRSGRKRKQLKIIIIILTRHDYSLPIIVSQTSPKFQGHIMVSIYGLGEGIKTVSHISSFFMK